MVIGIYMNQSFDYYRNIRIEMEELLPSHYSKVLEIGCGEGIFFKILKQKCEYWGIEPVQVAAKNAEKILNKVLIGTYQDVYEQLPDEYFDLIICNDVIEHMVDYEVFFQTIKKKMTKKSYIVGAVPNVRYMGNLYELLVKKDWMYKDGGGILDNTHLRFFTEKSLKRIFSKNNFLIEKFQGINSVIIIPKTLKRVFVILLMFFIMICSFGFYKDVQFLQFGFRIKH